MPRTHKAHDEEFKREAVELYLGSGKPRAQVARELGVSDGSLRQWERDLLGGSAGEGRAVGEALSGADPGQMAQELR
jgi:transposase